MINDLKLGFKIMKYGHSAKLSIILSIVMVVFGVFYSAASIKLSRNAFPVGYFMMLAQLILVQLIYTVNAASLVAASPRKKRLQTSVPALICMALMLAAYLLTVVSLGVSVYIMPESAGTACSQMMITVVMMGTVVLYLGIAYKYFVLSVVVFVLAYLGGYPLLTMGIRQWDFNLVAGVWGNFWLTAAIGLVILLLCGVLQYLLSLAVYKVPISRMALGARLRSQL